MAESCLDAELEMWSAINSCNKIIKLTQVLCLCCSWMQNWLHAMSCRWSLRRWREIMNRKSKSSVPRKKLLEMRKRTKRRRTKGCMEKSANSKNRYKIHIKLTSCGINRPLYSTGSSVCCTTPPSTTTGWYSVSGFVLVLIFLSIIIVFKLNPYNRQCFISEYQNVNIRTPSEINQNNEPFFSHSRQSQCFDPRTEQKLIQTWKQPCSITRKLILSRSRQLTAYTEHKNLRHHILVYTVLCKEML